MILQGLEISKKKIPGHLRTFQEERKSVPLLKPLKMNVVN